jgi:hypothetical protein
MHLIAESAAASPWLTFALALLNVVQTIALAYLAATKAKERNH